MVMGLRTGTRHSCGCHKTDFRAVRGLQTSIFFISTLFNLFDLTGFKSLNEAYKSNDARIKHVPDLQYSDVIG